MIPEVKQRIEQIQQGNMPEGYKKTSSGIAPVEWTDTCLGEIYTERKEPGNETLPLLMVSIHSGVSDGEVDEDDLPKKVKRIEDKSQYKRAATGDLVFNMMRAWQGAIGTVRTEGMVSPAYIVAEPNNLVDPLFMDYYMKTNRMVNTIHRQSYGVTDFRLRLYWDSFTPIKCVLPSVGEQQKIAAILTTQDKVIELKEKRLAEKQRQKKYLMQQLLTGKKRLPGFGGEWQQKKIGNLGEIVSGGTPETNEPSYWDGSIPWCTPTDITNSGKYISSTDRYITSKGIANSSASILPCGTIMMCSRASVGPRCINTVPMATNQGFKSIICNADVVDTEYLFYLIGMCEHAFIRLASGSAFLELSKHDFEEFVVWMPELQEQKAIATILACADREIELIRQSIVQEQQKEKALMQLLLTGIVRVQA